MYTTVFKRVFDLLLVLILAPFVLIFSIVTWCLVWSTLGRPVFFTQERVGRFDKVFKVYKFRTMNNKTDSEGRLLPDDVRLTRAGRIIRKLSLDELPQLFNVVKGDMSFIGPRPLLVRYLPRYSETHRRRHDVVPGITGLAQVMGRNALSWSDRLDYDVEYVDNQSFLLDLKIAFLTVLVVLTSRGVSQEGKATMSEFMGYDS